MTAFEEALGKLVDLIEPFAKLKRENDPLAEPWDELTSAQATLDGGYRGVRQGGGGAGDGVAGRRPRQCRAQCGARWRCIRWRTAAAI